MRQLLDQMANAAAEGPALTAKALSRMCGLDVDRSSLVLVLREAIGAFHRLAVKESPGSNEAQQYLQELRSLLMKMVRS